jgi:hypothetical protein
VVQVDPINPTLKAPGTKRFKLEFDDEVLSTFAFNFDLRRCDLDWLARIRRWPPSMVVKMDNFLNLRDVNVATNM